MAQQSPADWVNFAQLKEKISFPHLLEHFDLAKGLSQEDEELQGSCPICHNEGFKINLTKGSFSCPGCKKRGSVIDFVSAYKKVGLKEAGKLLKEILEASAKPQIKEAPASKTARKRKKTDKPAPTATSPDSGKENPEVVSAALKEELVDIIGDIDVRIKEIADMMELLKLKLEGKG